MYIYLTVKLYSHHFWPQPESSTCVNHNCDSPKSQVATRNDTNKLHIPYISINNSRICVFKLRRNKEGTHTTNKYCNISRYNFCTNFKRYYNSALIWCGNGNYNKVFMKRVQCLFPFGFSHIYIINTLQLIDISCVSIKSTIRKHNFKLNINSQSHANDGIIFITRVYDLPTNASCYFTYFRHLESNILSVFVIAVLRHLFNWCVCTHGWFFSTKENKEN